MVNTTAETLTVDGVVLNTLAKNIGSITGRLRVPAYRTGNIVIPGAHGEAWVPNKRFQANTLALPMWVAGCDDNGAIPAGSNKRREFFSRVNELVALFKSPNLLDVQWRKADGTIRQCFAECSEVMDFTADASPKALVGVVLTLPNPFWQDITAISQTLTGTGTSFDPTNFRGGSAPIEDMIYRITGPWTNPQATFSDGSYFRYNGAIAAAQVLTVNSGEWELTATGFTPNYANLVSAGGDDHWGTLPASAQPIALAGTARTTASSFQMTGRRKYLIG